MWRVYISSTYQDLVEERCAAKDAILGLGHFPVGMEEYAASDQRPLDRCLSDVRSCDAYVGIFAWRYGFRPQGNEKSITHLEYEEASTHGIPRFIYLLGEDEPWPRSRIPDEDQPRIRALRESLRLERLVKFFSDSSSLACAITQTLAKSIPSKIDKPLIPDLLPYLCDRSDQEFALFKGMEQARAKPDHPLVCVIHGDETEAHDKLLERLQRVTLPKFLGLQPERAGVKLYHLDWPPRLDNNMHQRLEMRLSQQVLDAANGTCQGVNYRFAQSLHPIACHSHMITETWQQQGLAAFGRFVQFWNNWPELAVGQQLFVFVFIMYQVNKSLGPSKLRRYRSTNAEIRATLKNFDWRALDRITGVVLPELLGATLTESADWARSEEAAKFCDSAALVTAVSEYYAAWQARVRPSTYPIRIPTDHLIPKLKELMSRTGNREERNP